jgi:hypothetical protein
VFLGCLASLAGTGAAQADATAPVTVPMAIVDNLPVITARIDGQAVPLMFDLGSDAALALPEDVLARIGTQPVTETRRWSDVKGNISEAPMFRVPRVEIGGVAFDGVVGHVQKSDPSYPAPAVFMQGMLGQPFFQGYKLVLDYAGERVTLIPDAFVDREKAGCRGTLVPFVPEGDGAPVTRAITDLGVLVMVWDTGAPVSVVRRSRALSEGASATGTMHTSRRFVLGGEDFEDFGPLELRLLDYAEPEGTDGFIGHSFFARHVVCVDFQRKAFVVRRQEQS